MKFKTQLKTLITIVNPRGAEENMTDQEILSTIKRCVEKTGIMCGDIDVAIDEDEDGDCYSQNDYFYINNIKTKYQAKHFDKIKYKHEQSDFEEYAYIISRKQERS